MVAPQDNALWRAAARAAAAARAPLAERLRPARLSGIVGQGRVVEALAAELRAGRLGSMILWGPPGSGKTTLARALAADLDCAFDEVSALASGVAELRASIAAAEQRLQAGRTGTLLFVDEIHRFHRGQQDALLHAVEDGRVTLVGATTENPAFHVNAALLSRARVLRLAGLDETACAELLARALADDEAGLGAFRLALGETARSALVAAAGGDGRRLLDQLERAAQRARARGAATIDPDDVEAARGEPLPAHDKAGDRHYDLLSALHKSLRGCDPDAAAYWVVRLLEGGEDPRVVARRLVRMASEDIGLADPQALGVALSALHAVEFLGLPEGDAALVQAAIHLALAPKSDAVARATAAARAAVARHGALPVPRGLHNAPTRAPGERYENPHAVEGGVTAQQHLPDALAGARFYEPRARGAEEQLARRLAEFSRRRARARGEPPAASAGTND